MHPPEHQDERYLDETTHEYEPRALDRLQCVRRECPHQDHRQRRHERDEVRGEAEGDEHPGPEAPEAQQRYGDHVVAAGDLADERR